MHIYPQDWKYAIVNSVDLANIDFEECYPKGVEACLLYTSPSPRDLSTSRMPSSA